jgi:hypothetical protein
LPIVSFLYEHNFFAETIAYFDGSYCVGITNGKIEQGFIGFTATGQKVIGHISKNSNKRSKKEAVK